MNLETEYLGLVLPSPLVASAGPLTELCAAVALSSLYAYYRSYRALLETSWS